MKSQENIDSWLKKELTKKEKTYKHFDRKPDLSKIIFKKTPQVFFELNPKK